MASRYGISPPRRKSCAACTKAKRRCDYALPACQRCSNRGIECHYPERVRSRFLRIPSCASPKAAAEEAPAPPTPCGIFSAGALMDQIIAADGPPSPSLSYTKELEGLFSTTDGLWDGGQQQKTSGPGTEGRNLPASVSMDPGGSVPDGTSGPIAHGPALSSDQIHLPPNVVAERLRHAATFLDRVPRVLVETLGTPWCHPDVFKCDMPRSFKRMCI